MATTIFYLTAGAIVLPIVTLIADTLQALTADVE
jgi:hypothetical protein